MCSVSPLTLTAGGKTMNDDVIRAAVIGERTDLAAILADLTPEQWGQQSLCVG